MKRTLILSALMFGFSAVLQAEGPLIRGIVAPTENLPWFDPVKQYPSDVAGLSSAVTSGKRKPLERRVELLLSRSVYPAEDRYLDAIVRLAITPEGSLPKGKLEVVLKGPDAKVLSKEVIKEIQGDQLFFSIRFPESLEGSHGTVEVRWIGGEQKEDAVASSSFRISKALNLPTSGRVELSVENALGVTMMRVPMTVGVPFPLGVLNSTDRLRLVDADGKEIPLQVKETARWSRYGSIRWVLCDFVAELGGSGKKFFLEYGAPERKTAAPITVKGRPEGFPEVDAGFVKIDSKGIHYRDWKEPISLEALTGAFVERVEGLQFEDWGHPFARATRGVYRMDEKAPFEVEQVGSEKVVLRTAGDYRENGTGEPFCRYLVRYVIHRDSPLIRIFHTWIYTGDGNRDVIRSMGWSVPTKGLKPLGFLSQFGKGGEWLKEYYLRQQDHDRYVRHRYLPPKKAVPEGMVPARPIEVVGEGKRAPGVIGASGDGGSLLFGVKDFWQNFPASLLQDDEGMVFYQWPKFGAPRSHPIRADQRGDVWRLWFAHEGENLSFRLPMELTEGPVFVAESAKESHITYGMPESVNAQGIAKTAEMWLWFAPDATPSEAANRTLEGLNGEQLRVVVDPNWTMASGAFYEMHPKDEKNFPEEERVYDLNVTKPIEHVERMGVYGKWIYGDLLRDANLDEQTANLYRTFRKAHWGWPYSWIPFARSGDLRYYKFAEAATRMMSDVAFCHYVDDKVRSQIEALPKRAMWVEMPVFREIGWHNRNLIPWAGYWGPSSRLYVDKADYLWHSYYLTGYDRARDVALAWAGATKVEEPEMITRGPITTGSNRARWTVNLQKQYLEMYQATFDPWFLAGAHALADLHLHRFKESDWRGHFWNTGPNEFQRYTGDAEYEKFYKAFAESTQEWTEVGWADSISTLIPSASYGWHLTGNDYYARRAKGILEAVRWASYSGDAPEYYRGFTTIGSGDRDMLFTSFYQQWFPYLLDVVKKAGKNSGKPIPPPFNQALTADAEILLQKEAGKAIALSLPAPYKVEGPNGSVVLESSTRAPATRVSIPANAPEGVYKVRFGGKAMVRIPISEPDTKEVIRFADGKFVEPAEGYVQHCFHVPPGTERFRITFENGKPDRQFVRQIVVWNPDGAEAWGDRQRVSEGDFTQKLEVVIDVPKGMSGRVWRISQPATRSVRFQLDPALKPVVAHTPERWFSVD